MRCVTRVSCVLVLCYLWHRQEERLPRWATTVKQVLLIQPSSAAAERVFSILKASFNEQQDCALVDYIQASEMAQYNKR